ncbi:putative diguanylate cyclase YcdT [Gimesia panareensis]|uniref:diguanylate cyclase n=1 Tax=Gimesia panareensis TaxID=2527978 RepID=A0A518FT82_9PLAN|nr:GGDEF domain-containing protein [Gimesia panareensis]QDV19552.1 putative diguanylate cyclase YcdT [Gimesia panareensis]
MRVSVTFRIVAGLVLLTLSTLLIACSLKLAPNLNRVQMEDRARYCEALAVSSSLFLTQGNTEALKGYLDAVVKHNPDISAAVLRQQDGSIFLQTGKTDDLTGTSAENRFNKVRIELREENHPWGQLEIYFPVENLGLLSLWQMPMARYITFVVACCFLGFYLFLRKTLQSLNPSKVIPGRVQEALDTLAGGLLILDTREQIVLANKTIARALRSNPDQLQGQVVSQLPWIQQAEGETNDELPWTRVLREGTTHKGVTLSLESNAAVADCFVVSCAPVLDDLGRMRGVLVSFEDVTELEKKKSELREMLQALHESREEIQKKNEELQHLATRDPLTSCLNRRSFYEQMETLWEQAQKQGTPLGCILLDIDHFKSINDNYGHSTGDLVLKGIGGALMDLVEEPGVLCRYGGEEFCILLPDHDIDQTDQVAERYRLAVESLEFDDLKVTSSFGATAISLGAENPQDLLDEADKCLYAAKRGGRNQVARWDRVPRDMDFSEPIAREPTPAQQEPAQESTEVSTEVAISLGSNMECLAQMIDAHDFTGLSCIAEQVRLTAGRHGISAIAEVAGQLQQAAEKADVIEAIYLTNRLMELCQSYQSLHLQHTVD